MNKMFLLLIMSALVFALGAQTGLFDLSYGDTRETALETLKQNGFEISTDDGTSVDLVPTDNYLVDRIYLTFNSDTSTLESWSIAYNPQEDEDIEQMVMDALISRHGEDYVWDDFYMQYYWSLENDRYVYAGYDYEEIYYWAEYTSSESVPDTEEEEEDWDF